MSRKWRIIMKNTMTPYPMKEYRMKQLLIINDLRYEKNY